MLIINDNTPVDSFGSTGLIKRPASFKSSVTKPIDIKLIPREEWSGIIRRKKAEGSNLSDIVRSKGIRSKDQNDPRYMNTRSPRWGYCWMYACVAGIEAVRAANNLPHVSLSAFGAAYTIKNKRDEGGWGALALEFAVKNGIPSEEVWPNFDTTKSWNQDIAADAMKYKVVEEWSELSDDVWDRDLTFDQKMTLLLSNVPVINDYMWWGHAVCSYDAVELNPSLDLMDPNRWGSYDRNSWGDGYGDQGFFVVQGRKAIPDNAVAPRSTVVF